MSKGARTAKTTNEEKNTRVCNKCGEEKDLSEFGFRCVATQKRLAQCKKCRSNHMKTFYEFNKEEIDEKHKNYREAHVEETKERQTKWYHEKGGKEWGKEYKTEHKEEIQQNKKEYYENNKENILQKSNKYNPENK